MQPVRLVDAVPPDCALPRTQPRLDPEIYRQRVERLWSAARQAGYDAVAVYGDREHCANLAWLTGFDPRFEEALLVLTPAATLITGPENQGYSEIAGIELVRRLHPPFGLLGQDRSRTRPLAEWLCEAGLGDGRVVGLAGWKYFTAEETDAPEHCHETPAHVVDALRSVVGRRNVVNAGPLFMHPGRGLRARNEVDQLAQFEHAAGHASGAVRQVIAALAPGVREVDAAAAIRPGGLPFSCHPILTTGPRIHLGLGSPSERTMQRGDPVQIAVGFRGGLTCRAGRLVAERSELPAGVRDYVERLAAPYFACVAEWYETVGIGVAGGDLQELVDDRLGDPFFGVQLNPGHLIHLEEWMHTPIFRGSRECLQSGQALQVDIIPATGSEYGTVNVEDGIALLDRAGREAFAARHPAAWGRIQARRSFMREALGIRLRDEVLPFSGFAGCLPPYLLAPGRLLARR